MSTPGRPAVLNRRRPPGRLGAFAPWPLVGVTLLLLSLIVFTPVLIANTHQPGPGLLTQAELVVDKTTSNDSLHFYVWALGETIRYDEIHIGVASSFNWTGTNTLNWTTLNWTQWHNGTDVLSMIVAVAQNPVALNISAYYVSPSGSTWYVGIFAFYVATSSPPGSQTLYGASELPGIALTSPLAVSNDTLPFFILLKDVGPGGVP